MNARIRRLLGLIGLGLVLASPGWAAAPAGRYTISGGTVYDTVTKLTWQQTPPSTTYAWAAAQTYCAGASATLGGSVWRVPTVKELLTLTDFSYSVAGSAFDPTAFPAPQPTTYWSASRSAFAATNAWAASFNSGASNPFSANQGTAYAVRCVR